MDNNQKLDLVFRWRRFFLLLDIPVENSDKKEYDMMMPKGYSNTLNLYIEIHTTRPISFPRASEYVVHVSDEINIPTNGSCIGIPIGNACWGRYVDNMTKIRQCRECNHFIIESASKCSHRDARTVMTPDAYKKIISAAEMNRLTILNRKQLDSIYLPPPIPENLQLRDEDGQYIYVVSYCSTLIRVGSCYSLETLRWNVLDMIDNISLDMILRVKDAQKILSDISIIYSSQDGWIRNQTTDTIIRSVITVYNTLK